MSILFLKGATFGQRVYSSLGLKHRWDIDLYVAQADVEAAIGLLKSSGYAFAKEFKNLNVQQFRYCIRHVKELPLRRADSGIIIEITWRHVR